MKVREKVKLLDVTDAKLPSSAVTSWRPPLLVQRTVSPTSMVRLLGVKKLLRTVTSWVAESASDGNNKTDMKKYSLEYRLEVLYLPMVFEPFRTYNMMFMN